MNKFPAFHPSAWKIAPKEAGKLKTCRCGGSVSDTSRLQLRKILKISRSRFQSIAMSCFVLTNNNFVLTNNTHVASPLRWGPSQPLARFQRGPSWPAAAAREWPRFHGTNVAGHRGARKGPGKPSKCLPEASLMMGILNECFLNV